MLNYDPKFEGKVLHAVFGWNDPRDLVKGYIDDLQEVSGGCCSFRSWSGVTSMKSMPVRTAAASRSRILSGLPARAALAQLFDEVFLAHGHAGWVWVDESKPVRTSPWPRHRGCRCRAVLITFLGA